MKRIILVVFSILAIASCKKKQAETGPAGPSGPPGPAGNGVNGTITGNIRQYDQAGVTYSTGLNTTTVSIDGTSYSTITDAAANYTLSNVTPGIYSITFNKNGNSLTKRQQISFPGNGTLYLDAEVYELPAFTITGFTAKDTTRFGPCFKFTFTITPTNKAGMISVFSNLDGQLDVNNPGNYDIYPTVQVQPNQTVFTYYTFSHSYKTGQTVYLKAYPASANSNGGYIDYATDKRVYTGYGSPSATKSVVIN